VTSGDHAQVTGIKFDMVGDGTTFDIKNDGIVDIDVRVRVSDGTGIVCDQKWNTLWCYTRLNNSTELVTAFFWGDSVDSESSFNIVDESEVLVRLLDGDDVHEPGWVFDISSHFSVNLNQSLHEDLLNFIPGEGVVKSVTKEDDEG